MIRVSNIKLKIDEDKSLLKTKIAKKIKVLEDSITDIKIYKQSIDARNKDNIHFVYTIDVLLDNEKTVLKKNKDKDVSLTPDMEYKYVARDLNCDSRPIVIGFGPAGIFCALILSQMGLKPIVLERGEDIDSRTKTVEKFWNSGVLNTKSNVQFGEGGAGTFSDGKLTTRIKDMRCRKVLEELVKNGAPEEIMYIAKPHVGTDLLKGVVKNIRNYMISLGAEVHFDSKVSDFIIEDNAIKGVCVNDSYIIKSDYVVLSVGHSARDTFEVLHKRQVIMEQKPFAMGVRIEHKQSLINKSQYGDENIAKILGAADYKLTYTTSKGRGVFTFCMCPGGQVVAAASENNMVAVNGMSNHARDDENANSAVLVQIYPEDFGSDYILAGVELQRSLERKAFEMGGGNYNAPAQLLGDFMSNKTSEYLGEIKNSYRPNIKLSNLNELLPDFMAEAIKEALPNMGKQLKGFDNADSLLTAVESRSSSPVRILRDSKTYESLNIKGLYPVGEGAGYAGGIVSAAVDGIVAAEKVALNIVENQRL